MKKSIKALGELAREIPSRSFKQWRKRLRAEYHKGGMPAAERYAERMQTDYPQERIRRHQFNPMDERFVRSSMPRHVHSIEHVNARQRRADAETVRRSKTPAAKSQTALAPSLAASVLSTRRVRGF